MRYKDYVAHTQAERIALETLMVLDKLLAHFETPMQIPVIETKVAESEPVKQATRARRAKKDDAE